MKKGLLCLLIPILLLLYGSRLPLLYAQAVPLQTLNLSSVAKLPPARLAPNRAICKPGKIDLKLAPFDRATNTYRLDVDVACYQSVIRVSVTVESNNDGTLVKDVCPGSYDCLIDTPMAAQEISLHANNLIGGQKYTIKVEATDVNGEKLVNKDQEPLLASKEFLHPLPEAPQALDFKIESVSPDYAKELLQIDLALPPDAQVQKMGWIIVDGSSIRMGASGPAAFTGPQIQLPFPEPMKCTTLRNAAEKVDYVLTVELTTPADKPSTQTLEFKLDPNQCAGAVTEYWAALQRNPAIVVSIIVIVLCLIGWVIILNRRHDTGSEDEFPKPRWRPWNPGTERLSKQKRLRLTVFQSPTVTDPLQKSVTRFPFIIGRENCDLNLPGDPQISGRHLQILLNHNQFYIVDLGSKNGTYINEQRLEPKQSTVLNGSTRVRLGRHTLLDLEPRS